MRKYFIILAINCLPLISTYSQVDYDRIYLEAKDFAQKGMYLKAREKAGEILLKAPEYYDAGVLIARTFGWEQKFDSARVAINNVLKLKPDYADALAAASDIEYWSENYETALSLIDKALVQSPGNKDYLLKKAYILMALGREKEARQILAQLLQSNPYDYQVNMAIAKMKKFRNRIILEYTYDHFSTPYKHNWHVASIEYQRDDYWGTWVAKVNNGYYYNDGENLGKWPQIQLEADAYPKITKRSYLYLNYGYSWGEIFPTHRAGIEYFQGLPHSWEASLGGRYLYFANGGIEHTFILTGSLGKYFSNNWLSFRPFLIFNYKTFAQSYYIFYKHYLDDIYDYWGLALGYGNSPDEVASQNNIIYTNQNNSYRLRLDYQKLLTDKILFRLLLGNSIEEYTKNEYRYRFDGNIYLAWLF
jgi:YaiO family outer membrane protein